MDPLTITATAVGLSINVGRIIMGIKDGLEALEEAPQTIADIEEEVLVVQAAIEQIERTLRGDPSILTRLQIDGVFNLAVKGSEATIMCLRQEICQLTDRHDWKMRVTTLWKQSTMDKLLGRLQTKKASLNILIQTMTYDSVEKSRAILEQNQPTFDSARKDLYDLIPAYPAYKGTIAESLKERSTDTSLYSEDQATIISESVVDDRSFAFDEEIINTRAYRELLARYIQRKASGGMPPPNDLGYNITADNLGDLIDLSSVCDQQPAAQAVPFNADLLELDLQNAVSGDLFEASSVAQDQANVALRIGISEQPTSRGHGPTVDITEIERFLEEQNKLERLKQEKWTDLIQGLKQSLQGVTAVGSDHVFSTIYRLMSTGYLSSQQLFDVYSLLTVIEPVQGSSRGYKPSLRDPISSVGHRSQVAGVMPEEDTVNTGWNIDSGERRLPLDFPFPETERLWSRDSVSTIEEEVSAEPPRMVPEPDATQVPRQSDHLSSALFRGLPSGRGDISETGVINHLPVAKSRESPRERRKKTPKAQRRTYLDSLELVSVVSEMNNISEIGLDKHLPRVQRKSEINNPRLLESIDEAIQRLILPELTQLKAEQKRRKEGLQVPVQNKVKFARSNDRPSSTTRLGQSTSALPNSTGTDASEQPTRRPPVTNRVRSGPGMSAQHLRDMKDARSLDPYLSATEKSKARRSHVEIEIDRGGRVRARRPVSPLLTAVDAHAASVLTSASDISAIPPDSFLDGSGPTSSLKTAEAKHTKRKGPSRRGDILAGAAAGLATATTSTVNRRPKTFSTAVDETTDGITLLPKPEESIEQNQPKITVEEQHMAAEQETRPRSRVSRAVTTSGEGEKLGPWRSPSAALLLKYFEDESASTREKRPSIRVRVRPSKRRNGPKDTDANTTSPNAKDLEPISSETHMKVEADVAAAASAASAADS